MKKNLTLLILLIGFSAFSQERELEELSEILDPSIELFYNSNDNMLDIGGYQIPLNYVEYRHTKENMLRIICEYPKSNPIYDSNSDCNIEEAEFQFKSKADVYKAINLMDKIKYK